MSAELEAGRKAQEAEWAATPLDDLIRRYKQDINDPYWRWSGVSYRQYDAAHARWVRMAEHIAKRGGTV